MLASVAVNVAVVAVDRSRDFPRNLGYPIP
jgi:hypothetical protein